MPKIEGFRQVAKDLYCSGEPLGRAQFDEIAALGVKVIVSVDGKVPDKKAAEEAGMRYIHLSVGYDGVPLPVQAALREVMRTTKGGVLIHCHHGKHRGPAAAAIASMLDGKCTLEEALGMMTAAGTGEEYQGLWRDVRNFKEPTSGAAAAPLVPAAEVGPLAREMTRIDDAFEKLEAFQLGKLDQVKALEHAALLREGFAESLRVSDVKEAADMKALYEKSVRSASEIEVLVKSQSAELQHRLKEMKRDCSICHKKYRN